MQTPLIVYLCATTDRKIMKVGSSNNFFHRLSSLNYEAERRYGCRVRVIYMALGSRADECRLKRLGGTKPLREWFPFNPRVESAIKQLPETSMDIQLCPHRKPHGDCFKCPNVSGKKVSGGCVSRARKMIRRRKAGIALRTIGFEFGLTRERVRQILAANGWEEPKKKNLVTPLTSSKSGYTISHMPSSTADRTSRPKQKSERKPVQIEGRLHARVKVAAAKKRVSIQKYVETVLTSGLRSNINSVCQGE